MSLNVETRGSGPNLVLLHGWGMRGAIWNELVRELAHRFRVQCIDLPGHGTSMPATCGTLESWIEVVGDAIPERAIVCGWSLGAMLALEYARSFAQRVSRVVLIGATPRFVHGSDWPHGIDRETFDAFRTEFERDPAALLKRFLALQVQGDERARDVLRRLRETTADGLGDRTGLASGLQILADSDLRASLADVKQSALLIHGSVDTLVPLAAAEYLETRLPKARLVVMPRAAHAPFIGREADVARRITEFCDEQ